MTSIATIGFALAGLCGAYRLLKGPTLVDRMIALDVMLISLMGAIAVDAAARNDSTYIIVAVVVSIIAFTAVVAASRFIQLEATRAEP